MQKQIASLVLVILLSSTMPFASHEEEASEKKEKELISGSNRIEISPDPNSVRDLGEPVISNGPEASRLPIADSSIGTYTNSGLIINENIPNYLLEDRKDLMMVIVSSKMGLWDARIAILESAEVAVRTTIPPSGFLLQGSSKQLDIVTNLPFVDSSHSVPIALILDQHLWDLNQDKEVEVVGWKNDDLIRLDNPGLRLSGSLKESASTFLESEWSPSTGIHFGSIQPSNLKELAGRTEVAFISQVPVIATSNDMARSHMESGSVEGYFITGLNGSEQRVAVADSGIDHDHGDFGDRIVQKVDIANDGSTSDPSDGHGTHVACTVLGSGFRTSSYRGVAPEAELYMQAMEDEDTGQLSSIGVYSLLNAAYSSGGARVHTNSWGGLNSGGAYTTQSEDADDRTSTWDQYWSYDGMTVLFAAGNERNDGVSPPGTAKNVITVGAHENRYSDNPEDEMYYWSSRGPTDDGRIKPDIVAAGDYVRSCRAQEASDAPNNLNNQWYVEYSGTSMATPAAAGAATLVREYLMEVAERPEPQGSLVKAMLILGAEDMATRDIPNNDEGWGRINLVNTLLPKDGDIGIFVDDRSRLSSGQEATYNFDVTRAGQPLKVVLAWSDYPGSTFSTTQLRNDLDLEIIAPNGVTYLGNDFLNGKSKTGGTKDSKNNVEVILIDSASTGIWSVKVKDSSHGGSRTYQPFSIAVRGVNVNDLTPDPAIESQTFLVRPQIPQVGEQASFSVDIINQGSGSIAGVFVTAHVNGNLVGTKSLAMNTGEVVNLEWDWTPESSDKGSSQIRIEIDPNDQLIEMEEANNILIQDIEVSAPGIQPSSENPWITLQDPSDTTTTWEIQMTNLAMFETNASIDASNPTRISDGTTFEWFKSFDKYYVELGPSVTTTVNLTMVHPAPPDPGTYSMVVTATDEDFDVESKLEIYFDVPILAQPQMNLPSDSINVDYFQPTNSSVEVFNRGNGAQAYDLELTSPAGWSVGFSELGPFQGSRQGSTGTLDKDGSIEAKIIVTPPGVILEAGTTFIADMKVKSRVSSEVWSFDIPLVIKPMDSVLFSPSSGESEGDIAADALREITVQVSNQGNREILLTPIERSLPGGWFIQGGLGEITIPRGSSAQWSFSIQGNGLAASGTVEVRFLIDGGGFFDWNTSIRAISGAIPSISFNEVVFSEGTSIQTGDSVLGLGAHPVGNPFDLGWNLQNLGTSVWEPFVSLELPGEEWSSSCSVTPGRVSPGSTSKVWCSVTIPFSEKAGSEPEITLVLLGDGIEFREGISLLVQTVREVQWAIDEFGDVRDGVPVTLSLEMRNTGNTAISDRLIVEGPQGWDLRINGGALVTLQPGETKSVKIEVTPSSSTDGTIRLVLGDGGEFTGQTKEIEISVSSSSDGDGIGLTGYLIAGIALLSLSAASAALTFSRTGGNLSSLFPSNNSRGRKKNRESSPTNSLEAVANQEQNEPDEHTNPKVSDSLQKHDEHPGWLWDPIEEEWVPDPDFGHGGP